MNCIIINNNEKEVEILKEYALRTGFVTIHKCISDQTEGLSHLYLNSMKADVVLYKLDNKATPETEFFRLPGSRSMFIFTSANPAHAMKSYELDAIDFLHIPFTYERFLKSMNKAQDIRKLRENSAVINSATEKEEFIFLKSGSQIHKINIDDILYLEKDSNYFIVHFRGSKKLLIRINFSELLSLLPVNKFMRVHKSYVIGFKHIDYIEGNNIIVNKEQIPIAVTYKHEFMKVINA